MSMQLNLHGAIQYVYLIQIAYTCIARLNIDRWMAGWMAAWMDK